MSLILDGTAGITYPDGNSQSTSAASAAQTVLSSISATAAFKNRIINGAMRIAQRATSATITAGSTIAAGYASVDRFYVYSTGANVTSAQVAGSGNILNVLQITGAASVTAVGVGQRIEAQNSADLAGSTCTLSFYMSNSTLTQVTWAAYYANTTDTFGTLASPTRTLIATNTISVTTSLQKYSASIAVPVAATTGIEIVLTVGAQTSGTWQISLVQFEPGTVASAFDYRDYGRELIMCQRYYEVIPYLFGYAKGGQYDANGFMILQPYLTKRVAPTVTTSVATSQPRSASVNMCILTSSGALDGGNAKIDAEMST